MRTALRAAGLVSSGVSMTVAAFAIQDDLNGFEGEERRSHQLLVQNMPSQSWEYKTVVIKDGVEARVPKAGSLEFKPEMVVDGKIIHAHYHHVKKFGRVIVNCHYYGISPIDFGRAITATVEIIDKVKGDRCFTFINVRKATTSVSQFDMKMMLDTNGILLAGTGHSVHFIPRP